jgi:hypothetical protein
MIQPERELFAAQAAQLLLTIADTAKLGGKNHHDNLSTTHNNNMYKVNQQDALARTSATKYIM